MDTNRLSHVLSYISTACLNDPFKCGLRLCDSRQAQGSDTDFSQRQSVEDTDNKSWPGVWNARHAKVFLMTDIDEPCHE